ncbi:MAG: tRNA-dihydrouridine synthase, partial [Gammaproteobacteria bacterium]|nr:tRNA-dihydrouridine synthase [Gammaproteobacteria bacterium]
SPKQNREIPPLRHDVVHALKRDFPRLEFIVNGGFKTLAQVRQELGHVDGVMIGREAYQNPWILADADRRVFGDTDQPRQRADVVSAMRPFLERLHQQGVPIHRVTRHMLGLFQGQPRARAWRRHLSQQAHRPGAGPELLDEALAQVLEPVSER